MEIPELSNNGFLGIGFEKKTLELEMFEEDLALWDDALKSRVGPDHSILPSFIDATQYLHSGEMPSLNTKINRLSKTATLKPCFFQSISR